MIQDNVKVPQAELNYTVDWTEWLSGDTIASSIWLVPNGLVKTAQGLDAGLQKATVKLKGGTVGQAYVIVNRIVTVTSGETDERSFRIRIVERKED